VLWVEGAVVVVVVVDVVVCGAADGVVVPDEVDEDPAGAEEEDAVPDDVDPPVEVDCPPEAGVVVVVLELGGLASRPLPASVVSI
jgi:hypothetical protein